MLSLVALESYKKKRKIWITGITGGERGAITMQTVREKLKFE